MTSSKEEVFLSKAPLTPEEEVEETSSAPIPMEEEWVQSSPASSSWPMMGLVRGELGIDTGCFRRCTAVRTGLEECSSPGMKEWAGRSRLPAETLLNSRDPRLDPEL